MSGDDASEQSSPEHEPRAGEENADEQEATAKRASNRVFVGNLSWRTSWQNLKDHMREVGGVRFADVFYERGSQRGRGRGGRGRGARPRSKGCGVVEYDNVAAAQRAIEELNESVLDDRKIFIQADAKPAIRISRPRFMGRGRGGGRGGNGRGRGVRRRPVGSQGSSDRKVYVGNLSYNTSWQTLKDHMRGPQDDRHVTFVDIFEDFSRRSKGCAVVEFGTPEDASNAIKSLNDTELEGRRIFVREDRKENKRNSPEAEDDGAQGRHSDVASDQSKERHSASEGSDAESIERGGIRNTDGAGDDADAGGIRIFLGNLEFKVTEEDLKRHFEGYNVSSISVTKDRRGASKGWAIMAVESEEVRQKIITDFHDKKYMNRFITVREDRYVTGKR